MRSIVGQIAGRVAVLLCLFGLFQMIAWWRSAATSGDANIGLGLLNFAATALLSAGWGFLDGRRPLLRVAPRWLAVALLTAAGELVILALLGDSTEAFVDRVGSYLDLVPFTVGLVLVPAVVGAVVGMATTAPRH